MHHRHRHYHDYRDYHHHDSLQSFLITSSTSRLFGCISWRQSDGIIQALSDQGLPPDEILGCKDMLSPSRLSDPVSDSSAGRTSSSTSKPVVSQVDGIHERTDRAVPIVAGCQTWNVRWACQIVAMPTTSARIPKTMLVMVLPAPSRELGWGARSGIREEFCRCTGDMSIDAAMVLRDASEV